MLLIEAPATSWCKKCPLLVESRLGAGNAWTDVKDAPQRMVCLFSAFTELASTSARFEAALKHAGLLSTLASLAAQSREQVRGCSSACEHHHRSVQG